MGGRGSAIEFRIDGRAVRETGTAMRRPDASTGRVVNAGIVVDAARGFDRGAEARGFRWGRARLFEARSYPAGRCCGARRGGVAGTRRGRADRSIVRAHGAYAIDCVPALGML